MFPFGVVFFLCAGVGLSVSVKTTCAESNEHNAKPSEEEILDHHSESVTPHSQEASAEDISEHHTIVALIDIVYTDGSKRVCSGGIIHNHVVITAAHCFIPKNGRSRTIQLELTFSFVVIGTKKMFDSGYERYLPISKILIHPKHRGWMADLALVFTFAGMESDKPGKALPLAGNNVPEPINSRLTVLSWGQCPHKNEESPNKFGSSIEKIETYATNTQSEWTHSTEPSKHTTSTTKTDNGRYLRNRKTKKGKHSRYISSLKENENKNLAADQPTKRRKKVEVAKKSLTATEYAAVVIPRYTRADYYDPKSKPNIQFKSVDKVKNVHDKKGQRKTNTTARSHDTESVKLWLKSIGVNDTTKEETKPETTPSSMITADVGNLLFDVKSIPEFSEFLGLRRTLNKEVHELTIEVFRYENTKTCLNMLEVTNSRLYNMTDGKDIVCFTSDSRYITDEDSGAPVISHGKLVAVTVGSVDCDGNHVAVGMKLSCFCQWIAANLPKGNSKPMDCCVDCCDIEHTTKQDKRKGNKKRLKKI